MNMLNKSGKMKKSKDLIKFQKTKRTFDKKERARYVENG